MTPEERKKVVKKVVFFAGKAAPGCKSFFSGMSQHHLTNMNFPLDYTAKLVRLVFLAFLRSLY